MKRVRHLLFLCVGALLVCELGLRAYAHLVHRERGVVFDPELGWRMVPGVVKSGPFWSGSHLTRINLQGWRDDDFEPERTAGKKRLIVLGDSFTFGIGVDAEERFTEVIERLAPGLEVYNLGMNAIAADQELLILQREGARYAHDFTVCAFYAGNDFSDVALSRNGYLPKPYFRLEGDALVLVPPRRTWDVRLRECGYTGEAIYRLVQSATAYRSAVPEWAGRDTTPLVAALLARMRDVCASHGSRFLVLLIHARERDEPLAALCARLQADHVSSVEVDVSPERDAGDPGPRLFLEEGHWSPAGHQRVARKLLDGMQSLGWL